MKCIQYGLYGQATFMNARQFYFLKSDGAGREHGLHSGSEEDMPKTVPNLGHI
jgi:hypothetical protein